MQLATGRSSNRGNHTSDQDRGAGDDEDPVEPLEGATRMVRQPELADCHSALVVD